MKELGNLLKSARESMDVSFTDIYTATKITKKYIIAIEDGDMSVFFAEVYYKSFVRSYAAYLGLDPEELLNQYNKRHNLKKPDSENENIKKNDKTFSISGLSKEVPKKTKSVIKPVILSFIIAIIGFMLFLYFNKYLPNKSLSVEVKQQPINEEHVDTVHADDIEKKTADTTKQKLSIEATSDVWLKVEADNKNVFEGTIVSGTRKSWDTNTIFTLKIGYAPGIKVFFNGKPIDVVSTAVDDVNTVILKKQPSGVYK